MKITAHRESMQFWLRPLQPAHLPAIAAWQEQMDDLCLFDRNMPIPVGAEALEAAWRDHLLAQEPRTSYWFGVFDDADALAGFGGLQGINYTNGDAVLPVFIAAPARRHGLGIRVAAMLLDLAFLQLRLIRATTYYRADNTASTRLLAELGVREEGRIRKGWYAGGEHLDIVLVGILADEWRNRREALSGQLDRRTVVTIGHAVEGSWSWPVGVEAAQSAETGVG